MGEKEELIKAITTLELEMFLNVKARGEAPCQQNQKGFKLFRNAQFSVWPDTALQSYLRDLQQAKSEGFNLCTLKYARMENTIPPLKESRLIDEIIDMQIEWAHEISKKYPLFYRHARPVEFNDRYSTSTKTYLRGELETYSDDTLKLLHADMMECKERGENQTEQIYLATVQALGFTSLEDAESKIRQKLK